jgi:ligand-binding sensor domain-containing protein
MNSPVAMKNSRFIPTFIFLMLMSVSSLYAQQPPMWQLTDEQGLPSMTVYDVLQDSKGYLWFGTELGICRYDGNRFQTFDLPASRGRAVSLIQEDSKGNIWFANFVGQLFYLNQAKVFEFRIPNHLKHNQTIVYLIDNEDNIWLGNDSLYCYTAKEHAWHTLNLNQSVNKLFISSIVKDRQGNIWVSSNTASNTVFKIKNRKAEAFAVRFSTQDKSFDIRLTLTATHEILLNRTQKEIFVRKHGLFEKINYRAIDFKNTQLLHGKADQDDNYWLCTNSGLYGFDKDVKPLYKGKPILPNSAISSIVQDREGNYWLTTLNDGVFVMPNKNILQYNHTNSNLSDEAILALTPADNDCFWVGLENGKVELFSPDNQVIDDYSLDEAKDIEGLCYDPSTQILYVAGGCLYAFKKGQKEPVFKGMCDAPKDLAIFRKQLIVANAWTGYVFDLQGGAISSVSLSRFRQADAEDKKKANNKPPYTTLRKQRARKVWVEQNRFWIAYADGLYYYEDGQGYELRDEQNQPIIARSFTSSIAGAFWVGTLEQGVYKIDNQRISIHLTTKQGLVSNYCRSLATDGTAIWIGTNKGLQVLDTHTMQFQLINQKDGLLANEILQLIVQERFIWVATGRGLFRLPKKAATRNLNAPPIYITGFSVWEKNKSLKSDYRLRYNQNNIKIDFQGLAYRSRGVFKYKYRMIGLDSSWVFTESTNNFARFPSLPTGKYEFQVKAINEDGIDSEGTAILQINILPPFWQTWWFTGLLIFGIVSVVSAVFWFRIRFLQKRNQIEQAMRQSQLAALQVQMNPHFIFNALNSIQEFILLNEKRLANEYLGKFADLMRVTLDMSTKDEVNLAAEIKHLELYLALEKLRFEDLEYQIELQESLPLHEIYIPAMLIQPYIENALKHGLLHQKQDRRLWLRFYLSSISGNEQLAPKKLLICEIEDSGVGRAKSEELKQNRPQRHKSFATSATRKRLELLNYHKRNQIQLDVIDLQNATGQATGTKVSLIIPI